MKLEKSHTLLWAAAMSLALLATQATIRPDAIIEQLSLLIAEGYAQQLLASTITEEGPDGNAPQKRTDGS